MARLSKLFSNSSLRHAAAARTIIASNWNRGTAAKAYNAMHYRELMCTNSYVRTICVCVFSSDPCDPNHVNGRAKEERKKKLEYAEYVFRLACLDVWILTTTTHGWNI